VVFSAESYIFKGCQFLRENASCINNLYAEFQFTPANIGFVTRTPASWPRNLIKVLFGGA
jgi:hypothetical protein